MRLYLIVVGTRPEIIKMAPIVWEMQKRKMRHMVFFTQQHFTHALGAQFLDDMGYNVPVVLSQPKTKRTGWNFGESLSFLQGFLTSSDGEVVMLAEGDTHSVALAAMLSVITNRPFVHVEAGLRSYDFSMREERYRRMADEAAAVMLCPLAAHQYNLEHCLGRKYVVGNTIADVVNRYTEKTTKEDVALITLHRGELLEERSVLLGVLKSISAALLKKGMTGVFPLHPHTDLVLRKGKGETFKPDRLKGIKFTNPLDYKSTLQAIAKSKLVITDSGGIQEEACIIGTPCCVIRPSTERQETIDVGAARIFNPRAIMLSEDWLETVVALGEKKWKHPYGSNVGNTIVDILSKEVFAWAGLSKKR